MPSVEAHRDTPIYKAPLNLFLLVNICIILYWNISKSQWQPQDVFDVFVFFSIWVLIFFPSYFKWTYGNPSAGPFRAASATCIFASAREQVQNSSFRELRGVDFFRIFLEVLPRSHGELPRKLYLGVAWKCVICILGWVNMAETIFSWSYLPYRWARGLSVPPRERFASAKLPRSFRKEYEHVYQKHTKTVASLCLPRLM